jgi:hypothetical protein
VKVEFAGVVQSTWNFHTCHLKSDSDSLTRRFSRPAGGAAPRRLLGTRLKVDGRLATIECSVAPDSRSDRLNTYARACWYAAVEQSAF